MTALSDSEGHGSATLHSMTEHDLEDLVNRVYTRLHTRLRQELIVGRERSGLGTDMR
jgi:hypothetical protein